MKEIWKDITGYEGLYQVSNLGNVKSLFKGKDRILKKALASNGYYSFRLSKKGKQKTLFIHHLVADHFLIKKRNKWEYVVNHKDFNRLNNIESNLEITTQRINTNKKHLKSTSKYTGVYWNKALKKWGSQIYLDGKLKCLGYYEDESKASEVYQNELLKIGSL